MTFHSKVQYALIFFLFSSFFSIFPDNGFKVRVLLDECEDGFNWQLKCSKGFALCDPTQTQKKIGTHQDKLVVSVKDKQLFINDHKCLKDTVLIIPQDGKACFDSSVYQGNFLVIHDGKRYLLINLVDLESYVFAVLRTESWPGWPIEVNKVFAIASRSYVMNMAMRMEKIKSLYHVKNTNAHQTYKGVHETPIIAQAVEETKGMFLADAHKQPILAMFDICCGGAISAHISNFNFSGAPYLARKYSCTHCKITPRYSWQLQLSMDELQEKMGSLIPEGKKLQDIKINKKDKAGLVHELTLRISGNKNIIVSGSKFYSLMKPKVKSLSFGITKKSRTSKLANAEDADKRCKVKFKGVGYGHQIGLCQWGAREMVRKGWDYQQILSFYYPGTTFMKLS